MTPAPGASARGTVETVELTKLQAAGARAVAESKATVPHLYARDEVNVAAWGQALAGDADPVDLVVWAAARALIDVPRLNGAYRDGRFELYSRVNVGIALEIEGGTLVPTIHDAAERSVDAIAAERRELGRRAGAGEITQPDLSGGTFTVAAAPGLRSFAAVVHRGQAGILALGEAVAAPVVRAGDVVPGRVLALTLSCDHRAVGAGDAGRFLGAVRALIERGPG